MAKNDLDQLPNDAEYEFKDEDTSSAEYQYEESALEPKKSFLKRRSILVIAAVVLVVFVVAKLIHHMHSSKLQPVMQQPQKQQEAPVNMNNKVQAEEKNNRQIQSELKQAEKNSDLSVKSDDQLKKLVNSYNQSINSIQQQQFQNQSTMMSLQSSVNSLSDQMNQISSHMQTLVTDYHNRKEADQMQQFERAEAKAMKQQRLRNEKGYVVDAVIPGRAWLKAADGSTITVTVGQSLTGYGSVLSINPYNGTVKTENALIPYGVSN